MLSSIEIFARGTTRGLWDDTEFKGPKTEKLNTEYKDLSTATHIRSTRPSLTALGCRIALFKAWLNKMSFQNLFAFFLLLCSAAPVRGGKGLTRKAEIIWLDAKE